MGLFLCMVENIYKSYFMIPALPLLFVNRHIGCVMVLLQ